MCPVWESIMLGTNGRQKWCEKFVESHALSTDLATMLVLCWCGARWLEWWASRTMQAGMHPMWGVFHPQFRPMHLLSHSPPPSWSPPPHPTHFTSEISSFPQRNQRALHQKTTSPAVQCSRPPTTMRFRRAVTMLVTTSIQGHTHSPGLVANWLHPRTLLLAISMVQQSQGAFSFLGVNLC
jgi:hypothetical protein